MGWYTGDVVFDSVLLVGLAMVPLTAFALVFMKAPYGRFGPEQKGLGVGPRLGWFLMELPAMVSFWIVFPQGPRAWETTPLVLAGLWTLHYANRGWVFPFLMRVPKGAPATFGLLVMGSGMLVTSMHGYLNATLFSRLGAHLDEGWLTDPRFLAGLAIYACGLALNVHSDAVLRNLRSKEEVARGDKVYRIPEGGGFRWVTNPSYLGELVMWTGFSILTWGLPGVFILAITAANLVPRALANHRWYREKFPDYPATRRALIPGVL